MTVSLNSSMQFTRDQIIRMACQLAGIVQSGQDPLAPEIASASDFMNLELQSLQDDGVILRSVERTTLTLVAGTSEYTLPSDTIDLQEGPNDTIGSIVPTTGGETIVSLMTRSEWMDLAAKTAATIGRPVKCYVERQALVKLVFWPTPDAVATTFRYAKVRLLKDMDAGNVTADLRRSWMQYLTYAVAAKMAAAKSLGMDRVGYFEKKAETLLQKCKNGDNQHGKVRFRVGHIGRHW